MGELELLVIAVVALLVIGPERLPEALRTLGLWLGRLRRSFTSIKSEIEKEIGMDEIRRQLHNEQIMAEMKRIEADVKHSIKDPLAEQAALQEDGTPAPLAEGSAIQDAQATAEPDATPAAQAEQAGEQTPMPRSEAQLEAMHAARQNRGKPD